MVDHPVDYLQFDEVVARPEGPERGRAALESALADVPLRALQPTIRLNRLEVT